MKGLVIRFVSAYLRRFQTGERDPETRRREALLLVVVLVLGCCCPLYVGYCLGQGLAVPAAAVGLMGLVTLSTPVVLRSSGSVPVATGVFVGGLTVGASLLALMTGGIAAPIMKWMLGFPLFAVLAVDLRRGLWSLAIVTCVGGLLGGLDLAGVELPMVLTDRQHTLTAVVSFPGVATMMMLIAWGFEGTRDRMVREVEIAHQKATEAHREVRLVLDSVEQGLLLVDARGRLSGEHSAAAEKLLGPLVAGRPLWEALEAHDAEIAAFLELAWPTLSDPVAPFDVASNQLPVGLEIGRRSYRLSYRPVTEGEDEGETLTGVVVRLTDVSAEQEVEAAIQAQRELHRLATRVVRDPSGMREVLDEGRRILSELRGGEIGAEERVRLLHTLKGNAALMGLERVSDLCHALESCAETGEVGESELQPLVSAWSELDHRVRSMMGRASPELDVSKADQAELLEAIDGGASPETLRSMVQSWALEPVTRRFERLSEQARSLAFRLGKGALEVEIEARGLRLPPERYAPFWSSLVHLVRNSIDHGLEGTPERVRLGKPRRGKLRFEAEALPDGGVRIALSDDGRGVDWDKLRAKAEAQNLGAGLSPRELFFAGGLSSKDDVSTVSGRGVGTSAIWNVVAQMGGSCEVRSAAGEGTTLEFTFPPDVRAAEPVDLEDSMAG